MMHDFSKPQPHVASREEIAKKKKLPVYMLIIVGGVPNCTSCLYGRGSFSESNCSSDDIKSAVCTSECLVALTKTIYLKAH